MNNYYIFINNGDINVIQVRGTREDAFTELNNILNSYERNGEYYNYELTDEKGNNIFTSYAN